MKFFKKIYLVSFIFVLPLVVSAESYNTGQPPQYNTGNYIGFDNPLQVKTICGALKLFLNALITLAVPVAVLFLVYAGFLFVWARGSTKELARAKRNILWVVIGIGIFMGAWLLGQIIMNTLNALSPNSQIGACK